MPDRQKAIDLAFAALAKQGRARREDAPFADDSFVVHKRPLGRKYQAPQHFDIAELLGLPVELREAEVAELYTKPAFLIRRPNNEVLGFTTFGQKMPKGQVKLAGRIVAEGKTVRPARVAQSRHLSSKKLRAG